jgi:hypothetical protein
MQFHPPALGPAFGRAAGKGANDERAPLSF